jgi:hypothetical protein
MNPSDDDKVRDLDIADHHEDINHLRNNQSGGLGTRGDAAFVAGKQDIDIVDEVLNRVAEDDVMAISESSLVLRSRTGLRIAGILLVMGVNQAAYGVDWAVMGNINAYATWHDYFGFGDTGAILATINALSTFNPVACSFADIISAHWKCLWSTLPCSLRCLWSSKRQFRRKRPYHHRRNHAVSSAEPSCLHGRSIHSWLWDSLVYLFSIHG